MESLTHGRADVLGPLSRHAQNPSAFLAVNDGNSFFRHSGIDGLVPYRAIGRRYWVQFAETCAAPEDRERLWSAFLTAARTARRRVVGVQFLQEDARAAAGSGFSVNQFGTSYSIDLSAFTLRGQKFVKTRNMITRSKREGVTVAEASAQEQDDPEFQAQLDRIDKAWLRDKGRHVKELTFLVGQRGGEFQRRRRLYVARRESQIVAYVSYSPVFGTRPGWLYDLTRRHPEAPPGVIEHIFAEAAQTLRDAGADWVHLGLTPFVGLDPEQEIPGAASPGFGKVVQWIGANASWLYPSAGQVAFKLKWRPHLVTPEYIAFPGRPRLRDVLCLARATNAL